MERVQHRSLAQDSDILERVNAELATLSLRTDQLRKQMTSLYYWNDAIGNRRVTNYERRTLDDRRRIARPYDDRRSSPCDRRVPLDQRCQSIESELSALSHRSQELADVHRKLFHLP